MCTFHNLCLWFKKSCLFLENRPGIITVFKMSYNSNNISLFIKQSKAQIEKKDLCTSNR